MRFLQAIYDKIKGFKTPAWLKIILQQAQDLMVSIATQAGQAYINYLKSKIIEAAQNKSWTSREKFDYVFKQAKHGFTEFSVTLKDNEINAVINLFVSILKKQGVIK